MPNTQTSVPAFTSGQVLTAQQMMEVNTGIPVFATTTTRDAAFGGTGEKTLSEGQFAYIEASNTTQYYDGAAWQTLGAGGLTLISTTAPSAATTVTLDNVFSSTYRHYLVTFNFNGGSTEETRFQFRYGTTTQAASYYAAFNLAGYWIEQRRIRDHRKRLRPTDRTNVHYRRRQHQRKRHVHRTNILQKHC
jgi:hypothetical protein